MALRSLASSVLRLRRPLATSTSTCVPAIQTSAPPTTATTTTRSYWQEVVRGTTDPRDGRNRYEDPENSATRSSRAQNAEGRLRRASRYRYYEKPWMKKKRLANAQKYRNQKRGVDELVTYIRFVQQNTPDRKE